MEYAQQREIDHAPPFRDRMDYAAGSVALYQYLEVLKVNPTSTNAVTARGDLASYRDILAEVEVLVDEIEAETSPATDPELAPDEVPPDASVKLVRDHRGVPNPLDP